MGQFFVTRSAILLNDMELPRLVVNILMRDDPAAGAKGAVGNNTIFGPIHDARIKLQYGRYGIEVQIDSLNGDGSKSWVVISQGLD